MQEGKTAICLSRSEKARPRLQKGYPGAVFPAAGFSCAKSRRPFWNDAASVEKPPCRYRAASRKKRQTPPDGGNP